MFIASSLLLAALWSSVLCQYEVPDALVEPLYPRGFKVSIPDEEGIKLFAFHGNINKEFEAKEAGQFAKDILQPKNGRWVFHDQLTRLKPGDVINYWMYVDYFDGERKLGYEKHNQEFVVKEFPGQHPQNETTPTTVTSTPPRGGVNGGTSGCESKTIVNGAPVCSGKLIFEEHFQTLDASKWNTERKFAQAPDYEFVLYTDKSDVLKVEKGNLVIIPQFTEKVYGEELILSHTGHTVDECTGLPDTLECHQESDAAQIVAPITSAQINTKNKFSFKYGKVEIMAKLPKGDWLFPELYLNPVSNEYGEDYESGQLRVAFLPGNPDLSNKVYGGCILGDTDAARTYAMKYLINEHVKFNDDFHKYTLTWSDENIVVSVDDKVYGNIYPPTDGFASIANFLGTGSEHRWRSGSKMAPFDKEMYLSVGVGAGGFNFPDRSDHSKPWINFEPKGASDFYKAKPWVSWDDQGSRMIIQYIKIWAV